MNSLFLTVGLLFFVNECTHIAAMKSNKSNCNQIKEVDEQEVFRWWSEYGNTWEHFLTMPDKTPWCPYIPHGFIIKINDNKDNGYYGWKTETITKEMVFICKASKHEVKSYNMFEILQKRDNQKYIKNGNVCSVCCTYTPPTKTRSTIEYHEKKIEYHGSTEREMHDKIIDQTIIEKQSIQFPFPEWAQLTQEVMHQEWRQELQLREQKKEQIAADQKKQTNKMGKQKWKVAPKKKKR